MDDEKVLAVYVSLALLSVGVIFGSYITYSTQDWWVKVSFLFMGLLVYSLCMIVIAVIYIKKKKNAEKMRELIVNALTTDGGLHKQWYLLQIAKELGIDLSGYDIEEGVAP